MLYYFHDKVWVVKKDDVCSLCEGWEIENVCIVLLNYIKDEKLDIMYMPVSS